MRMILVLSTNFFSALFIANTFLDQQKCYGSLQVLDRAASILLRDARTCLPNEAMGKEREDIVALLLEERYEEAEKMSSTFLCGNESSVAEE